jgi:hypothetical protein
MVDSGGTVGVKKGTMRVRHFGNTANNAFHNTLLLRQYEGIESVLPISMFGLGHGMSAPAWEIVDFDVPDPGWVGQPGWAAIPEAVAVNAKYSDLITLSTDGTGRESLPSRYSHPDFLPGLRRWANAFLGGKRWAQPLVDLRTRQGLARRSILPDEDHQINVLYGADSLSWQKAPQPSTRTVCLEHGTIRWVGADGSGQRFIRQAYREQVEQSMHLWVTNLDPRTLEIAEDLVPGRWSALPHPFVPDPRVPFPESASGRQALLQRTGSEYLVLLPSSQNWSKDHDKGSMKALTAFVELRKRGVDLGLVAVEWGLQLAESKAFLESAGVGANVAWVAPMARFGLQRMMANVDVVWDQFGLEAFGALALRAVEQGTPLVSRGLAPIGEQLIGGAVPWEHAATTDDIIRETTRVFEDMGRFGRSSVIETTRARYRAWLLERHSPAITAALQRDVYTRILDGTFESGTSVPGQWSVLLGEASRGEVGFQ